MRSQEVPGLGLRIGVGFLMLLLWAPKLLLAQSSEVTQTEVTLRETNGDTVSLIVEGVKAVLNPLDRPEVATVKLL